MLRSRARKKGAQMNLRATLIAACIGAGFFGVGYVWNYQPEMIDSEEVWSVFQSDHRKARAAVSRLLIEPHSARFSGLHTVDADTTRYVCGAVQAMNRAGRHVDAAFVYSIASDSARVDDEGRITSRHAPYQPCPSATEDNVAERQGPISPGALAVAKTLSGVIPRSGGGTMEQQLGQLAAQTTAVAPELARTPGLGSKGLASANPLGRQASGSGAKAAPDGMLTRQVDRPPHEWPTLASGQCPAQPREHQAASEVMARARDIELRWQRTRPTDDSTRRALSDEIKAARCALLTIDPADEAYPQAWAAFVRLQTLDQDIAADQPG